MSTTASTAARARTLTDDEASTARIAVGTHLNEIVPSEHLMLDFDAWMATCRIIQRHTIPAAGVDLEGE